METKISEIADGIYRLSTYVPDIAPPAGFTFNQFLVLGDEPLMFHTGLRKMFPLNRDALSRIIPPERLRWIAFGHFEADECGAMNEWLAVAPQATPAHGQTGCMVSLNDFADRDAARAHGRRGDRPRRRQARPLHRHAAHAARLGRRRPVRGIDANLAVRRPVHAARQRPGADRRRRGRAGDRGGRHLQLFQPQPGHGQRPSAASPASRRARWRSCTVRLLRATAPQPCVPWRTITTAAFPVRCSRTLGGRRPESFVAITQIRPSARPV